MLIAFDYQTYLCLPTIIPLLFYLLAHANAVINPMLYFVFINGFRNELKRNAKWLCNWSSKTDSNKSRSATFSRLTTFFKSRSTKLSRNQNVSDEPTLQTKQQSPKPLRSTPESPLRMISKTDRTNNALSTETEADIHSQPSTFRPLQIERNLGRDMGDWEPQRSFESIQSSRGLTLKSYVNRAYETDLNNRVPKSLPWKFNTFV
jgi:hypothetical protein